MSRDILSLGFCDQVDSNPPAQLQKLAKDKVYTLLAPNNKGADQTAWMCRLIWFFCCLHIAEDRFFHDETVINGAFILLCKRHTCDLYGTYRYWVPKYDSRPTDQKSRYIWIPVFRFWQKLKLVFWSLQTLALSKFTTGSGNWSLLVFLIR